MKKLDFSIDHENVQEVPEVYELKTKDAMSKQIADTMEANWEVV